MRENGDPAALGCPDLARGFPTCRATVQPVGNGYTYFDAPHTDEDWDFAAHAFLCGLGGELHEVRREARAILGFSWGFSKSGAEIEFVGPDPLGPGDWDLHRDHLAGAFPGWRFAPGFYQHPTES